MTRLLRIKEKLCALKQLKEFLLLLVIISIINISYVRRRVMFHAWFFPSSLIVVLFLSQGWRTLVNNAMQLYCYFILSLISLFYLLLVVSWLGSNICALDFESIEVNLCSYFGKHAYCCVRTIDIYLIHK